MIVSVVRGLGEGRNGGGNCPGYVCGRRVLKESPGTTNHKVNIALLRSDRDLHGIRPPTISSFNAMYSGSGYCKTE